jgi:hypothetical protein
MKSHADTLAKVREGSASASIVLVHNGDDRRNGDNTEQVEATSIGHGALLFADG